MDIKNLGYILEIAQHRSITKAAEALFVSQSSLSQRLIKLEQEIGTALFVRKKNQLVLTQAGELYIEAAQKVVQIQKQLYKNIANLNQAGKLRIGVSTQWGIHLITDAIPFMQQRFPGITIEVLEARYVQIKKQLSSEQLDMALLAIADPDDFPEHLVAVGREEILLAVSARHPYCLSRPDAAAITTDDLRDVFSQEGFIMPSTGSALKGLVDRRFLEQQFAPNAICEINRNDSIQYMVVKGVGVAMMPGSYRHDVPGIRYFSLTPPLFRFNALAFRKTLIPAEPERHLVHLIQSSPIFQGGAWGPG